MANPKYKGIYLININGKSYIGQDSAIFSNKRFVNHLSYLNRDIHNNKRMQKDYNIYGEDKLTYTILTYSDEYTKEDLNELEEFYIKKYRSFEPEYGYNQTLGSIGMKGYKYSEESRKKRSEKMSGERNGNAKITNNQFYEMVDMFKEGYSNSQIAEIFNLHDRYVSLIRHKKRFKKLWENIDDYSPVKSQSNKDTRKINYEDFKEIMKMINNGSSNKNIEDRYNLSSGSGSRIRNGKAYKDYWEEYHTTNKRSTTMA